MGARGPHRGRLTPTRFQVYGVILTPWCGELSDKPTDRKPLGVTDDGGAVGIARWATNETPSLARSGR
jgi:hypothetical protein